MRQLLSGLTLAVVCALPSVGITCDELPKTISHGNLSPASGVMEHALAREDFVPMEQQADAAGAAEHPELVELGMFSSVPVYVAAEETGLVELGLAADSAAPVPACTGDVAQCGFFTATAEPVPTDDPYAIDL